MTHPEHPDPEQDDPVYLNCRREAIFILSVWACCFVYTVTFCYVMGFSSHEALPQSTGPDVSALVGPIESLDRTSESFHAPLGLGIPDWVFYGIVCPWLVCIAVTFWFCLFMFKEDDLGEEQGGAEAEGAAHE